MLDYYQSTRSRHPKIMQLVFLIIWNHCSPRVSLSNGTPLGGVLSPFVCTVYINSYRSAYYANNHWFKIVDDTALVSLLSTDEIDYRSDIFHFVSWCEWSTAMS